MMLFQIKLLFSTERKGKMVMDSENH